MTIKEMAIVLLKESFASGINPDYNQIATQIREEKNSKTSVSSIRWYASKYKTEINMQNINEDSEIDELVDVALNLENDENEVDNWEIAEDLVLEYEKRKGWDAKKVTNPKEQNLKGYDIISTTEGQERHIEVKSKKNKSFTWLQLTTRETETLNSDPDYFIYLVEGDCTDKDSPIKVVEIDRSELMKMAKFKTVVRFSQLTKCKRIQFDR